MSDEQQPVSERQSSQLSVTPRNHPRSKNGKRLVLIVIAFVLTVGASFGASYILFRLPANKTLTNQAQSGESTTKPQSDKQGAVTTSDAAWHTVVFGNINSQPNIATKLAFPLNYQAIAYLSGTDSFRSLFGDDKGSFTYDGGDWKIGNPEDGRGQIWGDIQIMGIANDWYSRNGYASYGGFNGDTIASNPSAASINGYAFYTAKQKNDSLKALISDTSGCVKDSKKGFTISGVFNVCYKPFMIRQSYASYAPQITLSGYASIKGVPYVLFGHIEVRSGLDGYSDAELDKAGRDFVAGNIPAPTQKNIDLLIEALKHSTVTTK